MNKRKQLSSGGAGSEMKRPSTIGSEGYYYGGESSSSRSQYLRPPWSSGDSGQSRYSQAVAPVSRQSSGYFPPSFYQYQWGASGINLRPDADRSGVASSHLLRTSRVGSRGMATHTMGDFEEGSKGQRNWEHTGVGVMLNSDAPNSLGGSFRFTLLSYNILAAGLIEKNPDVYKFCDPANLDWGYRLVGIFAEIEKYSPDIICLQEVECAQFTLVFEPRLGDIGYRGVYKKKTGDKDDGCAIFYKANKFLLIDKLEIEFLQPHVPLLNRDNVALFVKLETRNIAKRQKLVVGTTHLLFNPKRHDVRLGQTQVLLAELDRFAFCGYDRNRRCLYHPILMTGDFNCQTHDSVVKLFWDGQLQYLDERGDFIKLLKRKDSSSLLPSHCGITDQCQHYKLILERYKRWTVSHSSNFELELKLQEPLVDLFPYLNFHSKNAKHSSSSQEVVSIYSPVGEAVGPSFSSVETANADSKFLARAAQKLAQQGVIDESNDTFQHNVATEHLHRGVLDEISRLGLNCDFGSGKLSHGFFFRDVYSSKLDRQTKEPGVTTKQSGWSCVDYIFQSMTWNDSFNKTVEGKLKLVRRLGLLSRSQCKQFGDIPNRDHPSDHFPLVAEFLLR